MRYLTRLISFLLLLLFCTLLSSCSNSEEKQEPGIIEKTQDKIAQEANEHIKTPLEQAKAAQELQESHYRQVEENIENQ